MGLRAVKRDSASFSVLLRCDVLNEKSNIRERSCFIVLFITSFTEGVIRYGHLVVCLKALKKKRFFSREG